MTSPRPVRTRFAPSPTGYMHIGGMRTAFFCWLWARHTGGTFILRIDDTDQQRNVSEALQPIFRAFQWLGLDWDEGAEKGGPYAPYYQSQRTGIYREAIDRLLAEGKAFKDFDAPEVVQQDRAEAEAAKRNYVNIRRSLELTPEQITELEAAGTPYVVRLLVPRDQSVTIHDAVRGEVTWDCGTMPDPVLMRSNGTFLYNFASVVDDAAMEITHVIRAEEHLTNTCVQTLLFRALGCEPPVFAHIPFITSPGSTKKLGKRDLDKLRNVPALKKLFDRADEIGPKLGLGDSKTLSPVMVEYYEKMGYLPAGILNALARLGWSLDDKTEIMDLNTIVENFTLDRIVKSSAGFDGDKLQALQAHWMNVLPISDKVAGVKPYLDKVGWAASDERLAAMLAGIGDRLKIFSDILDYREFFSDDETLEFETKPLEKLRSQAGSREMVLALQALLQDAESWQATALDQRVHQWAEQQGHKIGQVVAPLRLGVTGRGSGIGLFDAMELIGQTSCLLRLSRLAEKLV